MKKSQWILAAIVLAGLVSVVTYAMNYLGGSGQRVAEPTDLKTRELVFLEKIFPPPKNSKPEKSNEPEANMSILEAEEKTKGYIDFWFYNPNDAAVQLGLDRTNCRCGHVDVRVLPEERRSWVPRAAVAAMGVGSVGPLQLLTLQRMATHQIQDDIDGQELLKKNEEAPVPAGSIGWVRLGWGDRKGKQILEAGLWFDNPSNGKIATLNIGLFFHEPLRVRNILRVRPLDDADLQQGVHEAIIVWSSTRKSLRVVVTPSLTRGTAENDPFVVGEPEALSTEEVAALGEAHNEKSKTMSEETRGTVMCAYRVPITLRAIAADGKTPFDIGPFRRFVTISSPDVTTEPKIILVLGRVKSVIGIANDEEGGGVNFHDFLRSRGKVQPVTLQSDDPNVKLTFDRTRTASFLDATLEPMTASTAGSLFWTLRAKVLPNMVDGEFPRTKDPLYEDSAIYLNVTSAGKPDRSIRIPALGRATGR